ncbi:MULTISPECIES: microcin C ABC transporter permease YejB [unclassified Hahella]|uniref:microcin C ABC transporter permease YejB n=1 Tax=unclassified Hahella TaxID=2624107 RepID=UPI001C1F1E0E|nr:MULTISPECIES: microcin C ABC transporter permease YejB [unclassified Hahella]MBU6950884.1 microcin C ABC transporter permease YejB [Hahella sp. HN01]MDG9667222.1 microcin C ABC transporter permease YejB [Hahella sp. CR1]
MAAYIIRRLLLMIPTLWAIITINFFIIQIAPGGPVDQAMAQAMSLEGGRLDKISGANQQDVGSAASESSQYRGARGLDPEVIAEIEKRFGFDKPIHERYWNMLKSYVMFDFGDSLFKSGSVVGLIIERMPVTISLGLWTTLLIYMISIPLGISKALRNGHQFDRWTSSVLSIAYAIPGFLFAILLVILFAGGTYFDWFPLRGLVSENWDSLSWPNKILDYFWHITLPVLAMVISGFATLTLLTKNSFLDEINKQYVMTAKAKGLTQREVLYKHIFRNAMLIIISGFPGAFIRIFFTGSIIIEVIFSLEGIGLLGFEAITQRDYPIVFSTLYIFTLMGLLISLISDLTYTWVDPRIDFEKRG